MSPLTIVLPAILVSSETTKVFDIVTFPFVSVFALIVMVVPEIVEMFDKLVLTAIVGFALSPPEFVIIIFSPDVSDAI